MISTAKRLLIDVLLFAAIAAQLGSRAFAEGVSKNGLHDQQLPPHRPLGARSKTVIAAHNDAWRSSALL